MKKSAFFLRRAGIDPARIAFSQSIRMNIAAIVGCRQRLWTSQELSLGSHCQQTLRRQAN